MYRFSGDIDLDEIVGSEIQQICMGRFDVQFHFRSGTRIAVQGEVTLHRDRELIATWNEKDNWNNIAFQELLNLTVKGHSTPNERTFEIDFEDSISLRLHDSDEFECCQIYSVRNEAIIVV